MISIEKEKVAKGRSYVLKTSMLEAALTDAGIEVAIDLNYSTPQVDGSILEAFYWMPNPRVPHRRTYLRAGSLSSTEAGEARKELREVALPALVRWLSALQKEPDNSSLLHGEPHFEAVYQNGKLQVVRDPAV